MNTWIYLDQRDLDDLPYEDGSAPVTEELPLLYDFDGSDLPPEKFEGSRILHYDHDLSKMTVNATYAAEMDSDSPLTVYDFMTWALTDCVANGAEEYFMIFSSHGGGFLGYGGDLNEPEVAVNAEEADSRTPKGNPDMGGFRRKLLQPNQNIVDAINASLTDVQGAPARLDVIGFDACLMSGLGAIDEYRDVANYVLASEATEPGHGKIPAPHAKGHATWPAISPTQLTHTLFLFPILLGWAYYKLDTAASALDMAENFLLHYINETQACVECGWPDVHDTPKIMALVDTALFSVFHQAWEELSAEMLILLGDLNFYAALSRARGQTLSFESALFGKDAVDIGHFLENLRSICEVAPGSPLETLIDSTMTAYDDQFVMRGVGNGTAMATGMHITWPLKNDYKEMEEGYVSFIFQDSYNDDAPTWLDFLATFLNSTSPAASSEDSVCLASLASTIEPQYEGQLLLNPTIEFETLFGVVESDITIETDVVVVEYGLNLTHILGTRKLQDKIMNSKPRDTSEAGGRSRGRSHRRRRLAARQRKAQEGEAYFYLYGGDVAVTYSGPVATAIWDYYYFYLTTPEVTENIFVYDYGDGLKSFPVCYFSPDNVRSPEDFVGIVEVEAAVNSLGCNEGEVFFTISESGEANFALYTSGAFGTPSEIPKTAGGQIAPIVSVAWSTEDGFFDEIVGGFNETVVDWGADLSVIRVEDSWNLEQYGAETGLVEMYAFDFDNIDSGGGFDFITFPYSFLSAQDDDASSVSKHGGIRGLKVGKYRK